MTPSLEIIIPAQNPGAELAATIGSLLAQTDQEFGVVLSDNCSTRGQDHFKRARADLSAAKLATTYRQPRFPLGRIEHWNWAHAPATADWLKPLLPGQRLEPTFVERLRELAGRQPGAQLVRCHARIGTEWGRQIIRAPFAQTTITPVEFLNYFPAQTGWLGNVMNVAYRRVAWVATGGYSVHLPACAALNLNALLALHYGVENLPECLVTAEPPVSLNGMADRRVNLWLELWLVMRQARNYCLAARLPWPKGGTACGIWGGHALLGESS